MNTSFARVLQAIPPRIAGLELAIIGMAALALWTMGRTVFCRCGTVALWSGNVWSNQNSQQLADPYSVTHGTHGSATSSARHTNSAGTNT